MAVTAFPAALLAQNTLTMNVSATAVTVTGVTPGEDVVLFSCSKRNVKGAIRFERIVSDPDKDGVVTLTGDVPLRSIWIAVDQKSGAVATGSRPEWNVYVSPIAPALYRKDAAGAIAELEKETPRLILLLVRPGLGAWTVEGRDGGPTDRDNDLNSHLRLGFEDAQPIVAGKEKAPKNLKAGDVVAAIEPGRMDIYIGQVTQ
jgi:hypothetical protein